MYRYNTQGKSKMAGKKLSDPKTKENSIKMLRDVTSILDKHKIEYYLDFGTLLGAVREKGFIPWDDDMDISLVNQADYKKIPAVLKEIEKSFKYKTRLYTFEDSIKRCKKDCDEDIYFAKKSDYQVAKIKKKSLFGKDLVVLDIFFKYEYEGRLYWYAGGLINKIDNNYPKNGLKKINFYNMSHSIPIDYDKYLSSIYGEWRKKDDKWTCYESFALNSNN